MSYIHRAFIGTIIAKGALGLIQIMTACALYFGILDKLPSIVNWIVEKELSEDPNDFFAQRLLSLASVSPAGGANFYTVYFAVHGLLHISVVAALLSGVRWANHAAIAVLSLFVVYQVFEWFAVGGKMLIVLTAIDLIVIALTIYDHREERT